MLARFSIVAMVAACYAPTPSAGLPCAPGERCPDGQACRDGVCLIGGGTDARDPDAPADGPPGDGPAPRWALIAHAGAIGFSVDLQATQPGSTLIVGVETGQLDDAQVEDDSSNSYVKLPETRAIDEARDIGLELWLARDAGGGTKKVTASGSLIHALVVWEVSGIAAEEPLAAADTRSTQAATTSPEGAPITTTEPGQFVISMVIVQNTVSGLTADSAFVDDENTFGNGWAHLVDDAAPAGTYQARWIQPIPGTYCASSAAFRVR